MVVDEITFFQAILRTYLLCILIVRNLEKKQNYYPVMSPENLC